MEIRWIFSFDNAVKSRWKLRKIQQQKKQVPRRNQQNKIDVRSHRSSSIKKRFRNAARSIKMAAIVPSKYRRWTEPSEPADGSFFFTFFFFFFLFFLFALENALDHGRRFSLLRPVFLCFGLGIFFVSFLFFFSRSMCWFCPFGDSLSTVNRAVNRNLMPTTCLLGFTGFNLVLTGFTGYFSFPINFWSIFLGMTGFLLGFTLFCWVLPGFTEFFSFLYQVLKDLLLVLVGLNGFYWVLQGLTGFDWVLLGFTGFYWFFAGIYRPLRWVTDPNRVVVSYWVDDGTPAGDLACERMFVGVVERKEK